MVRGTTGVCRTCGRELDMSEFRLRKPKNKPSYIEWKCKDCRREYDTKQKRARRATKDGHKLYNDYMRDYMRGYVPKRKKP